MGEVRQVLLNPMPGPRKQSVDPRESWDEGGAGYKTQELITSSILASCSSQPGIAYSVLTGAVVGMFPL